MEISSLEALSTFAAQHCWLLILMLLLTLIVWYGTAPFSTFKKLGIPGPTPWPFVGNLPDIAKKGGTKREFYVQLEFIKSYGRICGFYFGRQPMYLITDVDLIKQVFVKNFMKFYNRQGGVRANAPPPLDKGLAHAFDENWKRIRTTITPTFTASKLKQVLPLMHESCETLLQIVEEIADSGKSADMYRTYGKFTMEVILSSAFGIQPNTQADPNNKYTNHAELLFKANKTPVTFVFPFLTPLHKWFKMFTARNSNIGRAWVSLVSTAYQMINLRRESGSFPRKDLLELMLQAELVDGDGRKVSKLTNDELAGQAMTFMLAGYETTASALAFVTYCLALNPDKQEKLLEEIDLVLDEPDGEMPGYDTVQNLVYLDMVVSESLRLYPPVFRFDRQCNEPCTINGIHFPGQTVVVVPTFAMHRDPENWPDPEKFEPERFP